MEGGGGVGGGGGGGKKVECLRCLVLWFCVSLLCDRHRPFCVHPYRVGVPSRRSHQGVFKIRVACGGGVPSFSDPAVFLSEKLLCLNARAQKRILSIGLYALGLFDLLCGSRMASAVYREEASRVSTRT